MRRTSRLSYSLGIVGAILGVDFKVFALVKHRPVVNITYVLGELISLELVQDCCAYLIYKTLSDSHGIIFTHVQRLQQLTEMQEATICDR